MAMTTGENCGEPLVFNFRNGREIRHANWSNCEAHTEFEIYVFWIPRVIKTIQKFNFPSANSVSKTQLNTLLENYSYGSLCSQFGIWVSVISLSVFPYFPIWFPDGREFLIFCPGLIFIWNLLIEYDKPSGLFMYRRMTSSVLWCAPARTECEVNALRVSWKYNLTNSNIASSVPYINKLARFRLV